MGHSNRGVRSCSEPGGDHRPTVKCGIRDGIHIALFCSLIKSIMASALICMERNNNPLTVKQGPGASAFLHL